MKNSANAMLADEPIRKAAARLRPDSNVEEVIARTAWSVMVEPADEVAWNLIAQYGAPMALMIAAGEHHAPLPAAVSPDAYADAQHRWSPRLSSELVLNALVSALSREVTLLLPGDADWTTRLDVLGSRAPLALWARGDTTLLTTEKTITMVGSRASTPYGNAQACELASDLATDVNTTILSGGAFGIDAEVSRGAMAVGGKSVAVLAGGVDRPYPAAHQTLFDRIRSSGGLLLSELPCGASPTKYRFLMRNRLLAALGDVTIFVEAGWRSGSLNTAGHARSLNRPLGAVPGPVSSAASAGCHRLLQEYDADCVTNAADILKLVDRATSGDEAPLRDSDAAASDLNALNDLLTAILSDRFGWNAVSEEDYEALNDLTHAVANSVGEMLRAVSTTRA